MILSLLMGLSLWSTPSPVLAVPYQVSRLMPYEELEMLVYRSADEYGVDRKEMLDVVLCEAEKTVMADGEIRYVADGQSHHELSYGREESYGLAMFHIPAQNRGYDNEIITEQTAKDPIYALRSMSFYFSENKHHLWSCWVSTHRGQ